MMPEQYDRIRRLALLIQKVGEKGLSHRIQSCAVCGFGPLYKGRVCDSCQKLELDPVELVPMTTRPQFVRTRYTNSELPTDDDTPSDKWWRRATGVPLHESADEDWFTRRHCQLTRPRHFGLYFRNEQ